MRGQDHRAKQEKKEMTLPKEKGIEKLYIHVQSLNE
jgi:hypothetical protein